LTTPAGEPSVVDVPDESRFVLEDPAGVSELVYDLEDGRIVIVHTGVPDAIGGRGLGSRLVQAAVRRAAREHLTVVPWCPFARSWLREHPEETGGITIDWKSRPPAA